MKEFIENCLKEIDKETTFVGKMKWIRLTQDCLDYQRACLIENKKKENNN